MGFFFLKPLLHCGYLKGLYEGMSSKGAPFRGAILGTNVPFEMEIFGNRAIYSKLLGLLCIFNDHLQLQRKACSGHHLQLPLKIYKVCVYIKFHLGLTLK